MNSLEDIIDTEEYRDTIATVDDKGKRVWLYPKKPKGKYYNRRKLVSVVLLILFFGAPLIKIDGNPLFLFNVFERKFVLFGRLFLPADFHLFVLATITFFIFIILFTVAYGRVWCGWACPQTIFMEMVFRRIEYWIEGDANQQRKLNKRPWDKDKVIRKTSKQLIFFAISLLIAHAAMAYMVGIEQTIAIASKPPTENLAGFVGLMAFTGVFYGVFAKFREQACIAVCPYGRLQSVLLTKDSVGVAYDFERGEPRGKLKKKQSAANSNKPLNLDDLEKPQGDCVDCKLCVHVCPTGIDIRNGSQMECVNCTACIDACDAVMEKIEKPKGLIRYASHNNIENKTNWKLRNPRVLAYTAVLFILIGLQAFLLMERGKYEVTLLRAPGSLYSELPNGNITNVYNARIINKSNENASFTFKLKNSKGKIHFAGNTLKVAKSETAEGVFVLELPPGEVKSLKTEVEIEVWDSKQKIETIHTVFLGPGG
ncbi:cytochrome c oxidase accessory protein CcoG [Microscilla marina]|uniref:Cytochrome c oxidase accessory protein CcoG n=1 Tax=Microscilla marina ATCC 23134 TaxID=313606 RepID=A1ZN74_MICM2|nr:cytochrome c oxidase accessory protein CcoG [Microscilla marina]EAY28255.1 cytochrome c oxidase accessory protein CcoG [Microscilla marina ATCC 23134]